MRGEAFSRWLPVSVRNSSSFSFLIRTHERCSCFASILHEHEKINSAFLPEVSPSERVEQGADGGVGVAQGGVFVNGVGVAAAFAGAGDDAGVF